MRAKILGKLWRLRWVPWINRDGRLGETTKDLGQILIRDDLSEKDDLEITIHELLHAANWRASEKWVERTSRDVARILWRLGWRRCS